MPSQVRRLRHPFCALSHLLGAALAFAGLIALLVTSRGKPVPSAAYTVYGVTLIALYTLSVLYHSLNVSAEKERVLQRLDHLAIFLLIAGTYTPVCLITLHGPAGIVMLASVWCLAAFGALMILCWPAHPDWLRVALYVVMGWLAAAQLPRLYASLGRAGIAWMVLGGCAYTFGIVFYAMDEKVPRPWLGRLTPHDVWHVFVLAGSVSHYVMMQGYVAHAVS